MASSSAPTSPSLSQRRTCGALMAVLTWGTTSHQPSALLNTAGATVSPKSSTAPKPPSAHRLVAPP